MHSVFPGRQDQIQTQVPSSTLNVGGGSMVSSRGNSMIVGWMLPYQILILLNIKYKYYIILKN